METNSNNSANSSNTRPKDVFCVDWEEWFHIGGLENPYEDVSLWDSAKPSVVGDTDILLDLLARYGHKATFLCVGWVAEKHPEVVRKIAAAGHEIGCHGYYHKMLWTQTPQEFKAEVVQTRKLLQDLSGQSVDAYRAPCFSMKRETFWAYPILAEAGFTVDISIVPAPRDNGGVIGFGRDPIQLDMPEGNMVVFPVSVMEFLGKSTQFSGGGHLRAFPTKVIDYGFRQNHKAGRPVMAYIHPREVNPGHPRIAALSRRKRFTAYYGLDSVIGKLEHLMEKYRFGTVAEAVAGFAPLAHFELREGVLVEVRDGDGVCDQSMI